MVENELTVHWEVAMDRPLSPRGIEPHSGLNLLQRYHPGTHIKKSLGVRKGQVTRMQMLRPGERMTVAWWVKARVQVRSNYILVKPTGSSSPPEFQCSLELS